MLEAVKISVDKKIPTKEELDKALASRYGEDLKDKISKAVVAICGLGGLGSNIAVALARAGVGKLILIDFDKVDVTNLHRQQYFANQVGQWKTDALAENLKAMAPYVELDLRRAMVTEENISELIKDADIVCEAFDVAENKAMLVNYVLEKFPEKYLIAASGMAGFASGNDISTERISEHFYMCGDKKSDVNTEGMGLVSSRVMLCAAHQAHTVIRIIAGKKD